MTPKRVARIVRAWLGLLIAGTILAGSAGYLVASLQPKLYEPEAQLLVGQSLAGAGADYSQLLASEQLSDVYARIATTRPVLERVIATLELDESPETLSNRVSVDDETALLHVRAVDRDPGKAAELANAVARELVATAPTIGGSQVDAGAIDQDLAAIRRDIQDLQREVDELTALTDRTAEQQARLDSLRSQVISLRSAYSTLLQFSPTNGAGGLSIVQLATPPETPVSPRPLLTALLAALVGLLVVGTIAFAADYLDDTLKGPEDSEQALGLATLGRIGAIKGLGGGRRRLYRLVTLLYPTSPAAEWYRTLRTNVEFSAVDRPIQTLLVTSAVPSEGKSMTSANLAVAFAQGGRRVLLVDADMRKPSIDQLFDLAKGFGLTTLFSRAGNSVESLAHPTEEPNLYVLPAGPTPPNPGELLASDRMRTIVETMKARFDLILFDTPPLEVAADAAVIAAFADATLLVVAARRTRRLAAIRAHEALQRANARILGVVLNGDASKVSTAYYTYFKDQKDAAAVQPGSESVG